MSRLVVVEGRSVKFKGRMYGPGESIDGLSEKDTASLQQSGFLVRALEDAPPKPSKARDDGRLGVTSDPWGLDPDGLSTLSLEQLNLLIRERDADRPPAPSKEAAIELLSRDFRPAEG